MIKFFSLIKFFCCSLWSLINFTRILIINIIFILLVSIIFYYIHNIKHNKIINKTYKKNNQVLEINFEENINNDTVYKNSFLFNLFNKYIQKKKNYSILDIVKSINHAKKNKNISGIVLKLNNFNIHDMSTLRYIGKYLNDFKKSGKKIYAIADIYDQNQYYLASFSNKIIMSPFGYVKLHGFETGNFYYKNMLERLKIKPNIFKIGEYKSALEPLLRNNMSNHNKIIMQKLLNDLWNDYLTTISNNRNIEPEKIFPSDKNFLLSLEKYHGDLALFALKNGLIDKLNTNSEFEIEMIKKFGWNKTKETYNKISLNDYINIYKLNNIEENNGNIAVITVDGLMQYGKNTSNIISGEIHKVYKNPNIKGLILKVNSPGGDIMAAQDIYNELKLLRKAHKPIVVLMGGMATSGAYWISTAGDYIISDPTTITGSIGIFSLVTDFSGILEKLGINKDGVNISDRFSIVMSKKMPYVAKRMLKLNIQNGYEKFINLVSQRRNKPIEEVKKIANGIIFTGKDAIKHGLVDALGDFDYAVLKISQLTKIKHVKLQWENVQTFNLLNFVIQSHSYILSNIINIYIKNFFKENFLSFNDKNYSLKETYSLYFI
ncbi:signal peptide peptidase SppA [Enterobacteriaceae endosymbiont of Donacia versicolorea]|uniref:signal peptide peptidase SppA n=1 Tax=Enterobacteriaceae endosymbiont of Donacia versicolorea TaxID=2675788 RepID=UPI001449CA26|nr:signal peptide peptidase SppA [Enterobacteriaceae endosymbiont of Donacia versicolorea]QJC31969.1 signal peptide peptidase SppA [Enterobacteriaceae endosymbiont of Donacia versicolorea]